MRGYADGQLGGNIRYARNAVSTSGAEDNTSLAVSRASARQSGMATMQRVRRGIPATLVQRAEEMARLAPENPEYMPMLGPQNYQPSKAFFPSTAGINPDFRAEAARKSIEPVPPPRTLPPPATSKTRPSFQARRNSKGLVGYQPRNGPRRFP